MGATYKAHDRTNANFLQKEQNNKLLNWARARLGPRDLALARSATDYNEGKWIDGQQAERMLAHWCHILINVPYYLCTTKVVRGFMFMGSEWSNGQLNGTQKKTRGYCLDTKFVDTGVSEQLYLAEVSSKLMHWNFQILILEAFKFQSSQISG